MLHVSMLTIVLRARFSKDKIWDSGRRSRDSMYFFPVYLQVLGFFGLRIERNTPA